MSAPEVFGGLFADASWSAWRVVAAAMFALPLSDDALAVFQRLAGRRSPPTRPVREAWLAVGRRGGKGRFAALLAVFIACFRRHVLAPGEKGVVMVLASDRRQARVVFGYIAALLDVPMLAGLVTRRTRESITLRNRVVIEVHTASYRAVRGYTILAAICDEVAFWRDDTSANPDAEIVTALRPAMATVPDALLIGISSPYARRGVLWDAYHEHFGKDDDRVLVVNADTSTMNPLVDPQVIAEAFATDPVAAASEYGRDGSVAFRSDIEAFVSRDVLDACTVTGRVEVPPVPGVLYVAAVDPAGGSGADSKTLSIAHPEVREHGSLVIVVDAVREVKPPFSPDNVVTDFATLLHRYGITTITGDRWGGEWPREAFAKHGIVYDLAPKPKSDLYRDLLPLLNSGRVELLDHRRLHAQLAGLERRTARGGRDTIDHAPHAHDDVANATALAILVAHATATTPIDYQMDAEETASLARWSREHGFAFSDPNVVEDDDDNYPVFRL